MKHLRLIALTFLALFSASGSAVAADKVILPVPEAIVAKTAKPPIIDGKIDSAEWSQAPGCGAFVVAFEGLLAHHQSTAFITFDDTYLYVAIRNLRGEKHGLIKAFGRRQDDDRIVNDFSNEIWICPPSAPQRLYQTLFNVYPGVLDALQIPSLGYTSRSWKGNWEFASTQSDTEWSIEAKALISSFGGFKIEDGVTWRGLFTTDILSIDGDHFRAWAPGGGFADIDRQGVLKFKENSPVFQLLNVESVFTGQVNFPVAVTGPVKGTAEVEVVARFGSGLEADAQDLVVRKSVTVADGRQEVFPIEADLNSLTLPLNKKGQKTGLCEISARTKDGGVLYKQTFPFVIDGFVLQAPQKILATPYESAFGVKADYAPLNKKLLLKIDRYYLPHREDATGGEVRLLDPATRHVIATRPLAPFVCDYSEFPMDVAGLNVPVQTDADWFAAKPILEANAQITKENQARAENGDPEQPLQEVPGPKPVPFLLEVDLKNAKGEVLASTSQTVNLIGYEFEWMNNTLGFSDKVIPPWTPIQVDSNTLRLWNKDYTLNGLGLADKIINSDKPQLSSMQLTATLGGKKITIPAGMPKVVKSTEAAVDLAGHVEVAGLDLQVQTRVEFDGFVFNTMTLSPKTPGLDLSRLSLVVTMPKSEATCLVTTSGYWASYHGWTPAKWDSRETSSGSRLGNFVPYILLTDSERGFTWFADNEQGWVLDPAKPTQEVAVVGDVVTMTVNFVNTSADLSRPLVLKYGWITSPQKPQPAGWRGWIMSGGKTYSKATTVFWNTADGTGTWAYYLSPFPKNYEKSAQALAASRNNGVFPFAGNIAHAIAKYVDAKGRTFNEFAADWGEIPGNAGDGNVARSRGPTDFQIWHFDQWIKKSGLSGLYFDENYTGEDFNYLTGGAYLLPDESIQPGYNYIPLRDYNIRLRHIFSENGVPEPNIWLHTTGGQPTYAWFPDVSMEAENVEPTNFENDYPAVMPASRLRAIGMGVNLGSVPFAMCQADRHWKPEFGPKLVHQFVGWLLLHDILPEQTTFWTYLSGEMQMWRPEIVFHSYWKNPKWSSDPDILVSAHSAKGQDATVWIFNTARVAKTAKVSLDLSKFGLNPKGLLAFDAETGEPLKLKGSSLSIEVPDRLWRAVRLVQARKLQKAETFQSGFDREAAAEESLGCPLPRGAFSPALVAGKNGQALALDKQVSFETRHHLTASQGRLSFALKTPGKGSGTVFSVGTLRLTFQNGKLKLIDPSQNIDVSADLPQNTGAEWHLLEWSWSKGNANLLCNQSQILETPLPQGMPIPPMGRGLDLSDHRRRITPTPVVFGPLPGAALDDLTMSE
jgi:hypothetical protein